MLPLTNKSGQVPDTQTKLLEQYAQFAQRVRDLSVETICSQKLYIKRFFASGTTAAPAKLFTELNTDCIKRFLFDYTREHGPGSRRWMQFSLRSFFKFAWLNHYTSCDLSVAIPTVRSVSLKSVPKGIDDHNVRLLLKSIDTDSAIGLRDFAIIQMLTTYGVRGIHIRYLRLNHIDWQNNKIEFQSAKRGKTIIQHLTPEVGNSLIAYIQNGRPNHVSHPEVFLTAIPPFHPFTQSGSFSSIIARRLRQAGIALPEGTSRGTHPFRHGFASRLTGKVPLKYIADMLGHRDIASSFIYSKVDFNALKETALPWPEEDMQ